MRNVSVIIPAAGASRRFGGPVSKIFAPLGGRAVLLRTLDVFAARGEVLEILVPVSPDDMAGVRERYGAELDRMKVRLIAGGAMRSDSVRAALAAVDERAELVCVHDAVRPCVSQECLDRVLLEAARSGSAILAWPIHGTVKRVSSDGVIEATVDRSGLWEAQTPQVFRLDILRAAYAGDAQATDDAHLVQLAGFDVRVVAGDARNVKITMPADLEFAQTLLNSIGQ
ncbi:MAG: 2-C-methyl-D-erythritol 4-phosphate cytidylyltransferase [Planctomycetaceae bacterium]|nr:2-C-methyl-D-erythritol 4-phosphate cytidylyltransferase [Planctomycetaceae bacterium]